MDPFKSVVFRQTLPQHSVAEHEVFMSFNGDSDAIAFHEWWNVVGAQEFARWLKTNQDRNRSRKPEGENP